MLGFCSSQLRSVLPVMPSGRLPGNYYVVVVKIMVPFWCPGCGACFGKSSSCGSTWTSKMPKIMDPILPVVSGLGCWAIILGTFGGPGRRDVSQKGKRSSYIEGCQSYGPSYSTAPIRPPECDIKEECKYRSRYGYRYMAQLRNIYPERQEA